MLGVAGTVLLMAVTGACHPGSTAKETAMSVPTTITVTSTAFGEGDPIPAEFTCDGAGTVPPLSWSDVPADAEALAIVVDDPDAPRGTFTHWVVLDLPPATRQVGPGELPQGAAQATNSGGKVGYYPPCPPSGSHRYRFTVFALSQPTGLPDGAGLESALDAVGSRASAQGQLVGRYSRGR